MLLGYSQESNPVNKSKAVAANLGALRTQRKCEHNNASILAIIIFVIPHLSFHTDKQQNFPAS